MATATLNEQPTYEAGDLVFAHITGYMTWPAILLNTAGDNAWNVYFVTSEDKKRIVSNKMWAFNKKYIEQFVTPENLEYESFAEAIEEATALEQDKLKRLEIVEAYTKPVDDCDDIVVINEKTTYEIKFMIALNKQRASLEFEKNFIDAMNLVRYNLRISYTNIKDAIQALKDLSQQNITQLMLLRNFPCLESVRKLRNYVGITPDYTDRVRYRNQYAECIIIRYHASKIYESFSLLFPEPYIKANFLEEYLYHRDIYLRYAGIPEQSFNELIASEESVSERFDVLSLSSSHCTFETEDIIPNDDSA